MKPVNNKSMLHFLFDQMEKLDNGSIDVDHAKAQANLAKQANNMMRYELERVKTKITVEEHNQKGGNRVDLREIEGINF